MMSVKAVFLLSLVSLAACQVSYLEFDPFKPTPNQPISCGLNFAKNFVPAGYPMEMHGVVTEDGYKLNMFRIQKKGTTIQKGLPVVMLQHGLGDTAVTWLRNGESSSLGLMLANQGFDVWLGNNRGNRFSREHVKLLQTERKFWDFSFEKMGEFDLPSFINKIREITGKQKITYVGHSQGTSQMFAALSEPEVRKRVAPYIDTFHALSPVVFLTNTEEKNFKLAKWLYFLVNPVTELARINHSELGTCDYDKSLIQKYIDECGVSPTACNYFKNYDPNPDTINYRSYGYFKNSAPGGYGIGCAIHYAQLIKQPKGNPRFVKYDHGLIGNLKAYGKASPPEFPLENITNRVRLYLAEHDLLVSIKDTSRVAAKLVNSDVKAQVIKRWGHVSFILPTPEAGNKFYQQIIDDIKSRQ